MKALCSKIAEHVEKRDLAQVESHLTDLWDTFLIADPLLGETDVDYKSELLRDVLWLKKLVAILDSEGKEQLYQINLMRKVG